MFDLAALESALARHHLRRQAALLARHRLHQHRRAGRRPQRRAARLGLTSPTSRLAGRGRGDHAWHSAAGEGLYVSVLLRPQFPAARLPLLPLAAGLAAADAIRAA